MPNAIEFSKMSLNEIVAIRERNNLPYDKNLVPVARFIIDNCFAEDDLLTTISITENEIVFYWFINDFTIDINFSGENFILRVSNPEKDFVEKSGKWFTEFAYDELISALRELNLYYASTDQTWTAGYCRAT